MAGDGDGGDEDEGDDDIILITNLVMTLVIFGDDCDDFMRMKMWAEAKRW